MKIKLSAILLCGLFTAAVSAETPDELAQKANEFVSGYFREKPADAVSGAFNDYDQLYLEQSMGMAAPPLIGFFQEVFKANPDRLNGWMDDIAGLESRSLKNLLCNAMIWANTPESRAALAAAAEKYPGLHIIVPDSTMTIPDITTLNPMPASMLDFCWGAFFASGDPKYVQAVLRTAATTEKNGEILLDVHAARWSALSIARDAPEVKKIVADFCKTATPEQKNALAQSMDEAEQTEYFGAVLVAPSEKNMRRHDAVDLLPGEQLPAQPEETVPEISFEPRPLPTSGQTVDYSQVPGYNELMRRIAGESPRYYGSVIVKGEIGIDGGDAPGRLMTRADMLNGGVFAVRAEPGKTLRFALHHYEPLDIYIAPELAGKTVDLGQLTLHEVPIEQRGKISLKAKLPPEESSKIAVQLYAMPTPPVNTAQTKTKAPDPAIIMASAVNDGQIIEIDDLSPINYKLEVSIYGFFPLNYYFTGDRDLDLGTTEFTAAPHLAFAVRPFADRNTEWKNSELFADGKTNLTLAPDNICGEVALRLTPDRSSNLILAEFTQGDARWYDLGDTEPDTLPDGLKPFDNSKLLTPDRYYRVTSSNGDFDLLLKMTEIPPEQ